MYICTVHTNMYICTVHTTCTYICVTMLLMSLYICSEQSSPVLCIDVLFVLYQLSEEEAKTQHLQNEAISLKFKLKEEEMLRKTVEEDRARLAKDLLKIKTEKKELQTEKQTLVAEKQELVDEKKELVDEKKELVDERNHLAVKNEELTEKLLSSLSSQSVVSEWFTSLTTLYTPHYIVHSSLHCTLLTTLYTPHYIVHSSLHCTLLTALYTPHYIVHSSLHCTLLTTLYTPHYIVHSSLHCTLLTTLCCVQTSKKESVMSSVLPEKMMSEVGTLLEQESSSLESLQDKLKILLEEWSKQTEVIYMCVFAATKVTYHLFVDVILSVAE